MSAGAGWLEAGLVGRPHGLDGSFHVVRPRASLLDEGRNVTIAGGEVAIVRRAGTDERPIVRLDGHETREAAEALRGEALLVQRTLAPELGPDEWWAEDLEGCSVRDGERPVGTVTRLVALPSCEALEVTREDAPALLVPLVRDAIRSVDIAAKQVDVDMTFVEGPGAAG